MSKKIYGLIGALFAVAMMALIAAGGAQKSNITEVTKVVDITTKLLGSSTALDTVLFESQDFSMDADSISFILELYEADSLLEGSTSVTFTTNPTKTWLKPFDSVGIIIKYQDVSPGGLSVDTTTFDYLTSVITKTSAGGTVYASSKITPANGYTQGKLWIKAYQEHDGSTQKIKFRIWRVAKWMTR